CVVTDVGDSALIVGDTGLVVPPGDPEALVEGLCTLIGVIEEKGQELSTKARERIVGRFSRHRLVGTTYRVLSAL
ncbi:MAG: group 1 glycosyl transferase, partial [Nitrospinota bacterium]|nr:group 1 glycosyl transferase [Nitrospinota bacterium]